MSSRERWVIYPLLFFAYCLAARDQLPYLRPRVVEIPRLSCKVIEAQWIGGDIMVAGDFTADNIEGKKRLEADTVRVNDLDAGILTCEQIAAVSPGGRRVAEIRPTESGAGSLTLFGPDADPGTAPSQGDAAPIEESPSAGETQLVLQAAAGGGSLLVLDANEQVVGRYRLEFEDADAEKPADSEPEEAPGISGESGQ